MYNYYQQYPNQMGQLSSNNFNTKNYQQNILKGHPVASLDEVKATSVDFDGSIFYFPDLANKRIYTKAISLDGNAIVNMYELKSLPIENINTGDFITRSEFEKTINELISKINPINQQSSQQQEAPSKINYKEAF